MIGYNEDNWSAGEFPPIPPCAKCGGPVNSRFFPISFTCESCRQRFCYSCRNGHVYGHICVPAKDENPAGKTAIQDLLARVKALEDEVANLRKTGFRLHP